MHNKFTRLIFLVLFICFAGKTYGQQGRIAAIQKKLDSLSKNVPGLNQKVQLNVIGGTIQQYLTGIASSNGLSISVDPKLSFTVSDAYNDITASNILVFLAQKYNLDVSVVGSIIYVTSYQDPAQFIKPAPKVIDAKYNAPDNTLSLALNNDSLVAVAKRITQVSGKNVVVPNSLQGKRVSGFIAAAPFETAMDKLAYTNEIKVVKTNDNFFVFQPLDENEELYINGDKNTSVRRTFKPAAGSGLGSVL